MTDLPHRLRGTWSPLFGQEWDDPATKRAAACLSASTRRVPPETAPFLVLGWGHRLAIWALSNDEVGRTGLLTDARLATIAWPEAVEVRGGAKPGALVRQALRAGGLLVGDGEEEHLADFATRHARILRDRQRKRACSAEPSAECSAEPSTEEPVEGSAAIGIGTGIRIETGTGSGAKTGPPAAAGCRPEGRMDDQQDGELPTARAIAQLLAQRIGGPAEPLVLRVVSELLEAGIPPTWLRERAETTQVAPCRPFSWKDKAVETWNSRPGAPSAVTSTEQARARCSAESWAERARDAEREAHQLTSKGNPNAAADASLRAAREWAQAEEFAREAGLDPATLRAGPGERS